MLQEMRGTAPPPAYLPAQDRKNLFTCGLSLVVGSITKRRAARYRAESGPCGDVEESCFHDSAYEAYREWRRLHSPLEGRGRASWASEAFFPLNPPTPLVGAVEKVPLGGIAFAGKPLLHEPPRRKQPPLPPLVRGQTRVRNERLHKPLAGNASACNSSLLGRN